MKKINTILVFVFILISASAVYSYNSKRPAKYDELIIQVMQIDVTRNLAPVKGSLSAINGVEYVNFCNKTKCFLLRVDRSVQPTNSQINTALRDLGYVYDIKEGVSINKLLENCN
jgi:hypothetical protein